MDANLPLAIRALRETTGIASKDLASRIGVSPSAMSLIESGKRAVKAGDLVAIAEALGVSPMALLESDSLVGRVSVAARTTEQVNATKSQVIARIQSLAELASLVEVTPREWPGRPAVNVDSWLTDARALARWALDHVELPDDKRPGDQLLQLASSVQRGLEVNVVVESFEDPVIGAAIVGSESPLILLNSRQGRQRALFTLAHELGHVLAANGTHVSCDVDFYARSGSERFANAFAAEFLLPAQRVKRLVGEITNSREAVAILMLKAGLSRQTSVYRLHNVGLINAAQRDALLKLRISDYAAALRDEDEREVFLARADELSPRVVTPVPLLNSLIGGYEVGLVGAAPIAELLGIEVDEVIERYGGGEISVDFEKLLTRNANLVVTRPDGVRLRWCSGLVQAWAPHLSCQAVSP